MKEKVILVTVLLLKPALEDVVLVELVPVIEATRQLSGCLSFDLYRLSGYRDRLALQETWETEDAHQAYALSPLKRELIRLLASSLAKPIQTWQVEELCLCGKDGSSLVGN
jgi:quinol monooxygenase YgiN